jgi:hypothetical protein
MLVFACSGLDAVLKQLIHDGLQAIIEIDPGAHKEFEKFAERRLRKLSRANASDEVVGIDSSFLSTLFTSNSPRQVLLVELRNNLLKDSLQSVDQIAKVASNFAITKQQVISSDEETKKAFEIRNQIIHEMDSDLASEDNRRQRTADEIKPLCENVLAVAERFVQLVLSRTRDYAA